MFFVFNDTATTEIDTYGHTLSLHDALPISVRARRRRGRRRRTGRAVPRPGAARSCDPHRLRRGYAPRHRDRRRGRRVHPHRRCDRWLVEGDPLMPLTNDADIRALLASTRTIAMLGASDRPERDSNHVMAFLPQQIGR